MKKKRFLRGIFQGQVANDIYVCVCVWNDKWMFTMSRKDYSNERSLDLDDRNGSFGSSLPIYGIVSLRQDVRVFGLIDTYDT